MIESGNVVLVLGVDAHDASVLAVCASENTAQKWIDENPDIWDLGYSDIFTRVMPLLSSSQLLKPRD